MKKWTICVCGLLWWSGWLWGQQAEVQFSTLSEADGLSQAVVTAILQDQRGFIWLGTQAGLNRYDGYTFKSYFSGEEDSLSLPGDYIRALYEDRNGTIWIGTERGGLCRYNRFLDHFERTQITESVRSLVEDRDGTLWIGTRKGLYEWQVDAKPRLLDPEDGLWSAKPGIEALWVDAQNQIWIGTEEGLFVMDVGREVRGPLVSQDDIGVLEVHCLYEDADGQLWVGTDEGLFTVDRLNEEVLRPEEAIEHEVLGRAEINALTGDRRGNLWIATFGRGLVRLQKNEGLFETYNQPAGTEAGLPSDFLYSLCLDASGLLWIGTYGNGASQLNLVRVHFSFLGEETNEAPGFYSPEVYSILEEDPERVWVGTPQGLALVNLRENEIQTFRQRDGLTDDEIYCMMQDRDGALWIGTVNGLDKLPAGANPGPGSFRSIDTLKGNSILSLMEGRDGTRWIGTDFGLFALRDTLAGPYFRDLSIQALYKNRDGALWMGTSRGMYQYDARTDKWSQDTLWPEPIRRSSVMSILADEREALWIGTEGRGLLNWTRGDTTLESYAVDSSPFPDNTVYSLLPDEEGQIWASTNLGLVRISRERAGGGLVFTNFDTRNHLPCDNFNPAAASRGASGTLYFGCSEGLVWFKGDDIRENTYAPPIVLTEFQLAFQTVPISMDGATPLSQSISETQEIRLKHTENVLYFEFSALNYIGNEKNQYAFRMIPYTQNWVYSGTKRSATYTNLDPGTYTFQVKASNNDGVWNENGISLDIIITPPVYQRPWFIALGILLLGLSIFGYIRWRTYSLEQNRTRLEQMVATRTEEVSQQKTKLEATLEDLQSTQAKLVDSEKMASLGQLTAGVAHEINNPITFVSGNVKPLKRDIEDLLTILGQYEQVIADQGLQDTFKSVMELRDSLDFNFLIEEIYQLLSGIQEGADRTAEIVRGLRNFSRLDEDDLKPADIHTGLESTLLILQNKLKSGIEVVRDYGDIPRTLCYPGKLNQVFMNVLTNAIQAIDGAGKIYITTQIKGENIHISIRDTGHGMPEEVRKRIFEPFFTTKAVGLGTGLGLAISFGIMEQHGGRVEVSSTPGKGTTFELIFPAQPAEDE